MSRGKLLHSSGSDSYAGFAPSLDAFISWAKEMDFRMEQAEKEAEREKDKKEKSTKLRKRIQVSFFDIGWFGQILRRAREATVSLH